MDEENKKPERVSSGPLRIYKDNDEFFVTGFGLWIKVEDEADGLKVIQELEAQGYILCF